MSSTSSERTPEFNKWRDDAASTDLVEFLRNFRGANLKKMGEEFIGPCPRCGGTDRFSINTRDRVFNCRGAMGGGYIDAVMHIDDCNFLDACEALTGYKPDMPKSSQRAPGGRKTREVAPDHAPEPEAPPAPPPAPISNGEPPRWLASWHSAGPVMGTHGEAYLAARGLQPDAEWLGDIRFAPDLVYFGFEDAEADKVTSFGGFPALISAIRNVTGEIIGLHRTYLERDEPVKFRPRGDLKRNKAKKIVGSYKTGGIWLYPPSASLVIGEGIETTRAAELLGIGPETASYVSAVALGNLSGGCTDTMPHPTIEKRSIMNGQPCETKPGLILPASVTEIIILGDGDSDAATTTAHLLTAGRRWAAEGRTVYYALAPKDRDWGDVLQEQAA